MSLLLLAPSAILLFGAAMLLGNRSHAAVYVLRAAVLIVGVFQIPLPPFIDIIGSAAIQQLEAGAYDFAFPPAFIAGRVVFLAVGVIFMLISLSQSKKRSAC
ncbi:hypothetical protein D3C75_1219680 [compost metagenome]